MRLHQFIIAGAITLALSSHGLAATGKTYIEGTKEDSDITGTLTFEETPNGLKISGTLENIPPGEHGFHIHEFGDCSDEAKSAGSHFNPNQKNHGHILKDGLTHVHAGDMGNLIADGKGMAVVNLTLPGLSLIQGKYSVAGRAVIIHEKKDDFSQPTGNAGSRIACGPILLTAK